MFLLRFSSVWFNYFFLFFGLFSLSNQSKCSKLALQASIEDHNTVVETSLRLLAGTWTSQSCETRPGPEYVLRAYHFTEQGQFQLIQHHYWDDSCSSPKLTITSFGRLQLRNSLIQQGAASSTIKTFNITITPQDTNSAKDLDRIVSKECPGQSWRSWRSFEPHTVFSLKHESFDKTETFQPNHKGTNVQTSKLPCLGPLKSTFNELKLLKIQLRPKYDSIQQRPKRMTMELLLGDIHSNKNHRDYYSPTSFQTPLIKPSNERIFLNKHTYLIEPPLWNPFSGLSGRTPPHLTEKPHLPPYLFGEWTSTRCEARPNSLFLTRKFTFLNKDSSWIGDHKFFADPLCKIPKFIVTARGHFLLEDAFKGTTNIDFFIEQATLTVLEQRMIYEMKLQGRCGLDEWQVNEPKELSATNGCLSLGIILPAVQKDIVKLEMDYTGAVLLYMGQVGTDSLHNSFQERPTSFQLPLVKCEDVPEYSQGLSEMLKEIFSTNSAGKNSLSCLVGLTVLLTLFPF